MEPKKAQKLFQQLDLVGVSDIAKILGWKMSKVTSYRSRNTGVGGQFPEPIGEVGGRPVWTRSQFQSIEKMAAEETTEAE